MPLHNLPEPQYRILCRYLPPLDLEDRCSRIPVHALGSDHWRDELPQELAYIGVDVDYVHAAKDRV